jgi:hypothetical protein
MSQGYTKNILKAPDGSTPTIENVNGIAFKTSALLTSNSSVTTGWITYNQYLSASTVIFSDVTSATNGLVYEYSSDGGTTILDTVNATFNTLNEFRVATFPLGKGTHIRITYTNGVTNQTKFYLSVSLGLEAVNSMGSVFTPVNINNIASITKTFLQVPDTNLQTAVYDFVTRTGNSLNVNVTNLSTVKPASTAPVAIDTALVTSLSPNGNTIKIGETIFINSVGNTSVTQLGAGATFAGTIVSLLTGKSLIVSANSNQPYTVNITQYNDLSGTQNLGVTTFTRLASVPFNEAIQMNGDYAKVSVTNTGGSATTGFFVNTYFGDMPPFPISVTNSGNFKTALLEAIPVGTNRIGTVGLNDGANSATINASNGISTSTDTSIIVQESINSTQGKNWLFTGTAGISTINSNLISAILNGATAIDLTSVNLGGNGVNQSVRSAYIQLVFTASPTAGAIRVVGSNDNLTFTPINFYDGALTNPSALQTLTVTGSATNRYLIANTTFKFLKLEITTAIVGATAQTITTFSPIAYATPTSSVITDGTTNGTFKPASTASVVGDTALVTALHPLGNTVTQGATSYVQSTGNNTSAQLAISATWTGTIDNILSYPQIVLSIRCDQAFTLVIEQFSDLAGTIVLPSITYTRIANEGFNQPITISGSYYRIKITNTGTATTTNLFAETWYGTISSTPNLTNAGSLPVDIKTQSDYIVGQATQVATINNILPIIATSTATDVGGYNSGTTTISSTATGGTFIFEGSNDNITFEPLTVKRTTLTDGAIIVSAITATASTLTYEYAVKYKFIRLRIATVLTGGSIRAYSRLSSNVFTTDITRVANSVTGNLQTTATQTGTWNIGTVASNQEAVNTIFIDVASAIITTSTTTGIITPTWGNSYQVNIPVTVIGGTSPLMSVQIQESNDTGTNWFTVYTFPNITTTGVFVSPKLNAKGNRVRYVQTISGTVSPTFTRAINRMQSNEIVQIQGSIPVITNSTITTGGTSQTALVSKFNRNYLEIQNTSAQDLWINFSTNAGVNIGFKIGTLQSWSPIGGTCPESSVTIFGATTGQTFAIAEF